MAYYFQYTLNEKNTWKDIKMSIEAFYDLIEQIFISENLVMTSIEESFFGSNAVFKVGPYIVKIYEPTTDQAWDEFTTEVCAYEFLDSLDIHASKLIAKGTFEDRYHFKYIIMDYIDGLVFSCAGEEFDDHQKYDFGKKLRVLLDQMNRPCGIINDIDIIESSIQNNSWQVFSDTFRRERLDRLHKFRFKERVFVNGDLNPDNILLRNEELHVIDFADAFVAPVAYEIAGVMCYLFAFEKAYIEGCFGDYPVESLVDICMDGMLMHEFGPNMIKCNLGRIEDITSMEILRGRLRNAILDGSQHMDSISYLKEMMAGKL